jgi:ribosomal protein L37AE/L43A
MGTINILDADNYGAHESIVICMNRGRLSYLCSTCSSEIVPKPDSDQMWYCCDCKYELPEHALATLLETWVDHLHELQVKRKKGFWSWILRILRLDR